MRITTDIWLYAPQEWKLRSLQCEANGEWNSADTRYHFFFKFWLGANEPMTSFDIPYAFHFLSSICNMPLILKSRISLWRHSFLMLTLSYSPNRFTLFNNYFRIGDKNRSVCMLLFISMRIVWAPFNIDFKCAQEKNRGKGVDSAWERKKGIFHSKKMRMKRFSTQMQPTVLKLIKDILFNIWPKKIYSTENLFQLECVWRCQGNSWKIDEKWRKKGRNEKLLLCIHLFRWLFLRNRLWIDVETLA